jgi:hypothetical protein
MLTLLPNFSVYILTYLAQNPQLKYPRYLRYVGKEETTILDQKVVQNW